MTPTADRIGPLHLVMIPTTDPDRSIAFYEALGFEKRVDFAFAGDDRWVELFPRGGTTGVALIPGTARTTGVQTGIILPTDDIDATHAELRSSGVDVDEAVARVGAPTAIRIGSAELVGPKPPMFYVRDPDGNALMLIGPD